MTSQGEPPHGYLLAPGEEVGEWVILSRLGRGGMGEVYAVREAATGHRFALKLFVAEGGDADFLRQRFRDMASALLQVAHPHVCKVLRTGWLSVRGTARPFLIMGLVGVPPALREAALRDPAALLGAKASSVMGGDEAGEPPVSFTAADLLGAARPASPALLERIWADTSDALRYLHGLGVVHGDIKPGNILLGAGGHATLVDFGLATLAEGPLRAPGYEPTCPNLRDAIRGTPEYLAPELLRGGRPTPQADLYALGATFFTISTGVPYVDSAAIRLLLDDGLPALWRGRFRALLSNDPTTRRWPPRRILRLSRRAWLAIALGAGAAGGTVALGGALARLLRAEPGPADRWARGLPISLGPGERATVGAPPKSRLPAIDLAREAVLDFRMEGKTWQQGPIALDAAATLHLIGPGTLTITHAPKDCAIDGTIRVGRDATLAIAGTGGGRPTVTLTQGATLALDTLNNLRLFGRFRMVDLAAGGTWRSRGKRLFLDLGGDRPILLGHGASYSGHWVSGDCHLRAVAGEATIGGIGHVYHALALSAAAGATLTLGGALFMYDYWKNGEIRVDDANAGTVVLAASPCHPLCAVDLRAGRTLLRATVTQDTQANWCRNKTCHDWSLRGGATLGGDGALTLAPGRTLRAEPGATLESGLTLSHATLAADARIRLVGAGTLRFGTFAARGPIRVDCAAAEPGARIVWEALDGARPDLIAESLPPGRTLLAEPDALTLR